MTEDGANAIRNLAALAVVGTVTFVMVLGGLVATAAGAQAGDRGLVTGVVVLGPLLPVDPGASVAWPAQEAVVRVYRRGGVAPVRTMHTGADGRFSVRLAPARYRFTAEPAGASTLPIPHDVTVKVVSGGTSHVRLWLDTGVRFPEAENVKPGQAPSGEQKYRQGLEGTTRRGPIVPVAPPEEPSDEPCAADLVVYHLNGARAAAVHSTAADGFAVSLPAGRYIVEPHSTLSTFDRAGPFSIRLPRREWLLLTIVFDTGIRFAGSEPAPR